MLHRFKNIINDATWFLRTGVSPTKSTSMNLKDLNHMTSSKFAMTMIAVTVVGFMYFASIVFLFFFPSEPHVSALVAMYKDMIVAVAAIVSTLVGVEGLVQWKHNSSSSASVESSYIKEEQIITEYLSGPKEDDYTLDINS